MGLVGQRDRVPGLLLGGKGGHLLGEVQTPLYNIKMYAEKKKSKPNSETFNWKQSARIARAHNINFATIIVIINHHSGESDGENRCACGIQLRRARGNFWDKHSCLVYLPPPPRTKVWYPLLRFREEGMETFTVGPEAGKTYQSKHGYSVVADKSIDSVKPQAGSTKSPCLFHHCIFS